MTKTIDDDDHRRTSLHWDKRGEDHRDNQPNESPQGHHVQIGAQDPTFGQTGRFTDAPKSAPELPALVWHLAEFHLHARQTRL